MNWMVFKLAELLSRWLSRWLLRAWTEIFLLTLNAAECSNGVIALPVAQWLHVIRYNSFTTTESCFYFAWFAFNPIFSLFSLSGIIVTTFFKFGILSYTNGTHGRCFCRNSMTNISIIFQTTKGLCYYSSSIFRRIFKYSIKQFTL